MHACVLQDWLTAPVQFTPPLATTGFVQVRVCVPPPQVTLHVDHADQPPFTFLFAEQLAFVPPPVPLQNQFHGPVPVTVEEVPLLQRPVVGIVYMFALLFAPHAPSTFLFAVHVTLEPP